MTPWQPSLQGPRLKLRPLSASDFDAVHAAASDPLIWEQHPDRRRHERERFTVYFDSGIASRGALVVIDTRTGGIIGSSRFADHDPAASTVEIGYTFLTRPYWGGGHNRELKALMLEHAFQHVERVLFFVGVTNFRSQAAMKKIGGVSVGHRTTTDALGAETTSVVFEIHRSSAAWPRLCNLV